jgi:uncharacterized protein (TIGR00255 family)
MLKSMTGYSKVTEIHQNKKYTVEIKSLNAKSFNPMIKIPEHFGEKELEIKNLLSHQLIGGKINFTLTIIDNSFNTININESLLNAYIERFKSIAEKNNLNIANENLFATALKMPDVFINDDRQPDIDEWNHMLKMINEAIKIHDNFRIQEGKALEKDITEKIVHIENLLEEITAFEDERITNVRQRIKAKLSEYINSSEQNNERYEQEIIYFLEKFDINEEKVRLKNHCSYFLETLQNPISAGSKLGFISQEIGREINTIGSKANHAEIQKIIVNMKDALEKIKEQLFNIL